MKERLIEFLAGGSNFTTEAGREHLLKFIQHELERFTDTWVYNSTPEDMDTNAKDYVERYLKTN